MTAMGELDPWLVAARFVQVSACAVLFGELLFIVSIARDGALARRGVRAQAVPAKDDAGGEDE